MHEFSDWTGSGVRKVFPRPVVDTNDQPGAAWRPYPVAQAAGGHLVPVSYPGHTSSVLWQWMYVLVECSPRALLCREFSLQVLHTLFLSSTWWLVRDADTRCYDMSPAKQISHGNPQLSPRNQIFFKKIMRAHCLKRNNGCREQLPQCRAPQGPSIGGTPPLAPPLCGRHPARPEGGSGCAACRDWKLP